MSEPLGSVRRDGDRLSVRLERRYDATVEEVWYAITEPASIKRWLFADAVLEHRDVSSDETAGGLGAGWHAHLAALDDLLADSDAIADRWRPRFDELHPRYDELVEAT